MPKRGLPDPLALDLLRCKRRWLVENLKWIKGGDLMVTLDLLPYELFLFVKEGLPMYYVNGYPMKKVTAFSMDNTSSICYKYNQEKAWPEKTIISIIDGLLFKLNDTRIFLENHHPEILEELSKSYPQVAGQAESSPVSIGSFEFALKLQEQFPTKAETPERIRRIEDAYPRLTKGEVGALARGRRPSDTSNEADERWYHRNKPK